MFAILILCDKKEYIIPYGQNKYEVASRATSGRLSDVLADRQE